MLGGALLAVGLLVIFQPEIRRALAELGTRQFFNSGHNETPIHEVIVRSVMQLTYALGGFPANTMSLGRSPT